MRTLNVSLAKMTVRMAVLSLLCVFAGALFLGGVAFAAGSPEEPLTGPGKEVTGTSAVLEGTLNPNATRTAGYYFAYNTNGSCIEGATTEPGAEATGKAIPVSTLLTGLVPSTKYTFCLVATHTEGETTEATFGPPVSFETEALKPAVDFEIAENITPFAAFLEGFVNPQNQSTSCLFEYGTTIAYGTSLPCEQASLEGYGDQFASLTLSGLKSATTYHFRVKVANATGTTEGPDTEFTTLTAEKPIVDSQSTSAVTPSSITLEAQINPNYQETTCTFRYGTDKTLASSATVGCEQAGLGTGFGDQPASAHLENLISGETYYYRAVAKNATGTSEGAIQSFTTVGHPLVSTGKAVNPTRSAVLLFGTVDAVGAATNYHFVYIDQAGYEAALKNGAANPYAEGGSSPFTSAGESYATEPISAKAFGLLPVTTYHYALVAQNSQGTVTGADKTFTTTALTPPVLTTGLASGVTQNTATISGTVNTQGLLTTYGFEIGSAAGAYGQPTGLGSVGAGADEANVTLNLAALQPGTTYHYRITATDQDGTSYGQDQTFTTGTFPNVLVTPPAPLPFLAVPAFAFPQESGITSTIPKALTRVQKLAKALKACHKKPKAKRAGCEKQAHERYGPPVKKSKKM